MLTFRLTVVPHADRSTVASKNTKKTAIRFGMGSSLWTLRRMLSEARQVVILI